MLFYNFELTTKLEETMMEKKFNRRAFVSATSMAGAGLALGFLNI